jgi:hypothetical protein
MSDKDILDERVLRHCGPFQHIRRWLRGSHPDCGVIVRGLTGLETLEETIRFVPLRVVVVEDNPRSRS